MWHMVHDDGDEEDLDEAEMREAIAVLHCKSVSMEDPHAGRVRAALGANAPHSMRLPCKANDESHSLTLLS